MSPADGKPESPKLDPEQLTRMLDIELAQKRAAWTAAQARNRNIRTISLLFLAIVVIGGMIAFFLIFTRLTEERGNRGARPASTSSSSR